jgi:hypothetical protein
MNCQLLAMLFLTSLAQGNGDQRLPPQTRRDTVIVGVSVMIGGNRQVRRITISMPAPPAQDCEDDDQRPAQLVGPFNINSAVVESENFDRWLFVDEPSETSQQRHLDEILQARIKAAAREHELTAAQRAKLRLAGRGDIKRFFDEVAGKRSAFEIERQSYRTGRAALQRLVLLSQIYQEGPFGDGSLFAKTLQRINGGQTTCH